MTNTILFDLQAAAMAMQANGQTGTGEVPADGASFSDILAGVTAVTNGTDVTAANTDGAAVSEELAELAEVISEELSGVANEVMKAIENADDGVKKALRQLLETVVNAIRGSRDKGERKTDIFLIISDGSAGFMTDDEDMLVSMEILSQLGITLETDTERKADQLLSGLEEVVKKLFPQSKDEDDTDENTAAEVLAALLGVQPEELEELIANAEPEVKAEAVANAAETLKAPMEVAAEQEPEIIPEAEKLFRELVSAAVQTPEPEEIPAAETVAVTFAAVKINNAAEQVSSISGGNTGSTESTGAVSVEITENTEAVQTAQAEGQTAAAADNTVNAQTDAQADAQTGENTGAEPDNRTDSETDTANAIDTAAAERIVPEQAFEDYAEVTERAEAEGTESGGDISRWEPAVQVTSRLEREISDFGGESGTKELVMILEPEELGQVAVKIVKEGPEVSIVLSAQYSDVGRLINERAAYLGSSLSGQSVDVKDVQVVEPGNAAEQMGLNFTDKGFSFTGGEQGYRSGSTGNGYGDYDEKDETIADDIGEIRMREARLWTTA